MQGWLEEAPCTCTWLYMDSYTKPPYTWTFHTIPTSWDCGTNRGPSPPFSGTPLSTQSERHTSDDAGSFKKSMSRDELEVSSLVKKSMKNTGKKNIGAQLNKIWEDEHDDIVIPYPADLARQEYKVDKTFKASAFFHGYTCYEQKV